MNKMFSIVLLLGGVVLIILGVQATNSLSSDLSRFFTGSPTDKAVWMLIAGVVAGVIGLCTAFYLIRRGHRVTIIDRAAPEHEGCSFGNAGMVVPSHFVPLAAPGMVWRGLKWMWSPESPFWVKPRLDRELFDWGWKFWRASNKGR